MKLEGVKKVFYSLLEIANFLFSIATRFQNLTNHTYPGKNNIQIWQCLWQKKISLHFLKTNLYSTSTVQLQRCVRKDLVEKQNNILLHVVNTIFIKNNMSLPYVSWNQGKSLCLKYWMANWYCKSNINNERLI